MPWVGLQFVFVVIPDHTLLHFVPLFGEFLSLTTAIQTKSEQTRCDKRKQQCFLTGLVLKSNKGFGRTFLLICI